MVKKDDLFLILMVTGIILTSIGLVRKNLLDLSYHKYNSLLNTSIIALVTLPGILVGAFINN